MLNKIDEVTMKLMHYFITEKGYNPVILQGLQNEIWLENLNSDYKIIRIVSNYIHNNEQLNFDLFRSTRIIKKIKLQTFSFTMNTLNIFVNLGDNVEENKINKTNQMELVSIKDINELNKYDNVLKIFPDIITDTKFDEEGVKLFMKITGDINKKNASNAKDWIGLGAMDYRGLGFSNIRLPDDDSSYLYKYDTRVNTFPEEVFIHEFLHTLERNTEEYGIERPELHDNEKYGYENKKLIGLKEWYQDYMNKNINTSSGKIGLSAEIFTKKPVKAMDFEYTHKLDYLKEPENIMEELSNLFTKIINLFKRDEQLTPAENEA